jgi:hypothetical protein
MSPMPPAPAGLADSDAHARPAGGRHRGGAYLNGHLHPGEPGVASESDAGLGRAAAARGGRRRGQSVVTSGVSPAVGASGCVTRGGGARWPECQATFSATPQLELAELSAQAEALLRKVPKLLCKLLCKPYTPHLHRNAKPAQKNGRPCTEKRPSMHRNPRRGTPKRPFPRKPQCQNSLRAVTPLVTISWSETARMPEYKGERDCQNARIERNGEETVPGTCPPLPGTCPSYGARVFHTPVPHLLMPAPPKD